MASCARRTPSRRFPAAACFSASFVLVYGIIFGAGLYYIAKPVRRGPDETPPVPQRDDADSHTGRPMAAAGNP